MSLDEYALNLCKNAKKASKSLSKLGIKEKNELLISVSKELVNNKDFILSANEKDILFAKENNLKESFIERLSLSD